ncbi:PEP-CTERM sorting domain-containing protein [Chlamydiota bacterium]
MTGNVGRAVPESSTILLIFIVFLGFLGKRLKKKHYFG